MSLVMSYRNGTGWDNRLGLPHALGLAPEQLLGRLSVPHRGRDHGVPHRDLKRAEVTPLLQPAVGIRVAAAIRAELLEARATPNHLVEARALGPPFAEWDQHPDVGSQFAEERGRDRNVPELPSLRRGNSKSAVAPDARGIEAHEFSPAHARADHDPASEPVGTLDRRDPLGLLVAGGFGRSLRGNGERATWSRPTAHSHIARQSESKCLMVSTLSFRPSSLL